MHSLADLGFHRIEIETRAALHRRIIKEGLEFLADDLLDEDKSPELEFEPVKVLLGAVLRDCFKKGSDPRQRGKKTKEIDSPPKGQTPF